jgi:amino acid adenylation domain-containing protein
VEGLKLERDTGHNPLFDVMFVYDNYDQAALDLSGLSFECVEAPHPISKFDFTLEASEGEGLLKMKFEYSTELFREQTLRRYIGYFKKIVSAIVQDRKVKLSAIDILSEGERHQVLKEFNKTEAWYPKEETIISLFEKQVERTPENIALKFEEETLTYAQLNKRANAIASRIQERIPRGSNEKVGLLFRPGLELVTSMVAILKAGCAYVPLSPEAPVERNEYILRDCSAALLLVEEAVIKDKTQLPYFFTETPYITVCNASDITEGTTNLVNHNTGEDLMYIIYTSGTTGQPKGVEVKNKGVLNTVYFFSSTFSVDAGAKVSNVSNVTFDASTNEIWPCLIRGGMLHIAPDTIRQDPELMKSWLIENRIDVTYQPTAIAEYLLKSKWLNELHFPRVMVTAGDRLNYIPGHVLQFKVYNLYGPTEDSVWSTWAEVRCGKFPMNYSIGKPIANKKIFILSRTYALQPIGVAGELCISGDGLARGYVNNNALTEQQFIQHPFCDGEKLYKTGDLARWLPDGNIEFLGRIDNQIKIRGYRIELGDIESHLLSHELVDEAVVITRGEGNDKYLVAYYVSAYALDSRSLKAYLSKALPGYMLPSYFIHMNDLPLTPHGKLNRKALPEPAITLSSNHIAASNEVEEKLAGIWSAVLKIPADKISMHSNFFDLGGHSINIISLSQEISKHFNCVISVANIFRLPTIAMIANCIMKGDQSLEEITDRIEESLIEAVDNISLLNHLKD